MNKRPLVADSSISPVLDALNRQMKWARRLFHEHKLSFLLPTLLLVTAPVSAGDVPRFAEVIIDAGFKVAQRPLVARLDDSDDIHLIVVAEDEKEKGARALLNLGKQR